MEEEKSLRSRRIKRSTLYDFSRLFYPTANKNLYLTINLFLNMLALLQWLHYLYSMLHHFLEFFF